MTDERPEALLKSALEKIVYFEARSSQLTTDVDQTKAEVLRLKSELAQAAQREIELRRVIAELEVRATRAHSEREAAARVTETLRRERAELIGKILDASRIHRAGEAVAVEHHDLAQFIAELRAEVLEGRVARDVAQENAARASAPRPTVSAAPNEVAPVAGATNPGSGSAANATPTPAPVASEGTYAGLVAEQVRDVAQYLRAQGRLGVTAADLSRLENAAPFPGHVEETLFGFSVRELAAPDSGARLRAAERLKALAQPAAAPALAAALHAETDAAVKVALLGALAAFGGPETVPVVQPHLAAPSPDVRLAALKALLALDPSQAAPHLAAATRDPDKAVRRRASLLALGLEGTAALELGAHAVKDADADVRALAALVLGASGAESARPHLVDAMLDADARVVKAAAQALSRLLGHDVTPLAALDLTQRRREVRRLAQLPARPVQGTRTALERLQERLAGGPKRATQSLTSLVAPDAAPSATARAKVVAHLEERTAPAPTPSAPAERVTVPASTSAAVTSRATASPEDVQAPVVAAPGGRVPVAPPQVMDFRRAAHAPVAPAPARARAHAAVAVLEAASAALPAVPAPAVDVAPPSPELVSAVLTELRSSIRGRPLEDLAASVSASADTTRAAMSALLHSGQAVRRGHKYFVA